MCDALAGVPWRDDDEPVAPLPPGRRPQRDSFFFVLRVVPAGERLPIPAAPRPAFPEYDQVRDTLECHIMLRVAEYRAGLHVNPVLMLLGGSQVVKLIGDCWEHKPCARPPMAEVEMRLRNIIETAKSRARLEQRDADFARRTWSRV